MNSEFVAFLERGLELWHFGKLLEHNMAFMINFSYSLYNNFQKNMQLFDTLITINRFIENMQLSET